MQFAAVPDHHVEYLLANPRAAHDCLQGRAPMPGRLATLMRLKPRGEVPANWPAAAASHELIDENEYPTLIHYLLNGSPELGHGVSDVTLGACRGELPGVRQLRPYSRSTFLHDKAQAAAFDGQLRALGDALVESRWLEDVAARGETPDPLELQDFQGQLAVLRDVYAQAARQSRAVLFAPHW